VVAELHRALSSESTRFEDAALVRMVQRCDALITRLASDASSTLFLFEDGPFTRAARQTAKVRVLGSVLLRGSFGSLEGCGSLRSCVGM
jgi:hypothetical protein